MKHLKTKLLGALALALALAASPATTVQAQAPIQELRIGINTIPRTLEPFFDTTLAAFTVYRLMFDTLVRVDEAGRPVPWLAESWEVIDDLTWEMKLRQDVTFHDGTAFDASDVKYSLDWTLDPENAAPWSGRIALVDGVEVVDDHTVRITTDTPWAALLQGLLVVDMVPDGYYEGEYQPSTAPVGTGRYRFVQWSADDYLTIEAYEGAWHGDTNVQRVTFRLMPEANTRTSALSAGEIHIAFAIPPEQVPGLEGNGFSIQYVPIGQIINVNLAGTRSEELSDKRVRQAINHAIDQEAIVDFIMGGFGQPLDGQLVGSDGLGYDPAIEGYEYDPERARELLAEAGYPDGFTIPFHGTTGNYPKDREISEAIVGMLAEVGITAELELLEQARWAEGLYTNTLHPMFMSAWIYAPAMDAALPFTYFQCVGRSFADIMCNEEFDDLYTRASQEFDAAAREALLQQAGAVLRDEAPLIFLHQLPYIYGLDPRLENVRFFSDGTIDFTAAELR